MTYAAVAENISKLRECVNELMTVENMAVQIATIHSLVDNFLTKYSPATGAVSIRLARKAARARARMET